MSVRSWVTLVTGIALGAGTVLGAEAVADTLQTKAGAVTAMRVARGTGQSTTTGNTWAQLPGALVTVNVPSGQRGFVLATFQGQLACGGTPGTAGCQVEVTIDSTPLAPASNPDVADEDAAHSDVKTLVRTTASPVATGKHTVRVLY